MLILFAAIGVLVLVFGALAYQSGGTITRREREEAKKPLPAADLTVRLFAPPDPKMLIFTSFSYNGSMKTPDPSGRPVGVDSFNQSIKKATVSGVAPLEFQNNLVKAGTWSIDATQGRSVEVFDLSTSKKKKARVNPSSASSGQIVMGPGKSYNVDFAIEQDDSTGANAYKLVYKGTS